MPDPLEDFAYRAAGADKRDRIDRATLELIAAFRDAGIDALVLKGPVTARWLYRPDEVRGYTDCDLLAPPDRFVTAARTLKALGYHSHGDEATHPELWEEGRSAIWHRTPGDVWVDLQWRLPGAAAPPGVAWALLWAEHVTMDIGGVQVAVANEPARALHLALAVAREESRKGQLDLERAVKAVGEPIWQEAAALARQLEAAEAIAAGLAAVPGGAALARRLGLRPDARLI